MAEIKQKGENKIQHTKIEWAKNPDGTPGFTWNPITGCLNGCTYCYARRLANTRLKERYLANKNLAIERPLSARSLGIATENPFYPRFWPDKLTQPYNRKKPAGIFTCDMSDLFGIGIPECWTRKVLEYITECPQHRFYLLTKQPQNLIKFSPFPDNAWVGVSVTSSEQKILYPLTVTEAKVKFISFEPLLYWSLTVDALVKTLEEAGTKWVIIGGQTKPTIQPKIEWVKEIVEACDKVGIPVFLKNNLRPLLFPEDCSKPNELMDDIFWESDKAKLRQEFPKESDR